MILFVLVPPGAGQTPTCSKPSRLTQGSWSVLPSFQLRVLSLARLTPFFPFFCKRPLQLFFAWFPGFFSAPFFQLLITPSSVFFPPPIHTTLQHPRRKDVSPFDFCEFLWCFVLCFPVMSRVDVPLNFIPAIFPPHPCFLPRNGITFTWGSLRPPANLFNFIEPELCSVRPSHPPPSCFYVSRFYSPNLPF